MIYELLQKCLILSTPVIVSGVLHMVVVRLNLLSVLKIPLHSSLFGANKTWRGVVVMPPLTFLGMMLAKWIDQESSTDLIPDQYVLLSLCLGLAYVAAELPNSWIKRKLKIPPGLPSPKFPLLFAIGDQADSVIGCTIVYALYSIGKPGDWVFLVIFGTLLHLALNLALFGLGLRKNAL
jgi:CDP-diacylglycerol--serine O-phosphatidyltransferase